MLPLELCVCLVGIASQTRHVASAVAEKGFERGYTQAKCKAKSNDTDATMHQAAAPGLDFVLDEYAGMVWQGRGSLPMLHWRFALLPAIAIYCESCRGLVQ